MENWINDPTVRYVGLWILLGLGTGVAAKLILPGKEDMGWFRTILFGLLGSFAGNYVAPYFFHWHQYDPMSIPGLALGLAGAIILVLLNKIVTKS